MKSFDIVGRYGHSCSFVKYTGSSYKLHIHGNYPYRCGGFAADDEREGLSFVDPAGGPFISVNTPLNEYHNKLPKKKIVSITHRLDEGIVITVK